MKVPDLSLHPIRHVARVIRVALFAATAALAIPPQALAGRGGGHGGEGRGGGERGGGGDGEDHDRGRHLGWYKHGGPVYAAPEPYVVVPYTRYAPVYPSTYAGEWVGRRAWGGGGYAWQGAAIAVAAAWGAAWGLGSSFAYYAPPVVFVPPPTYIDLPPMVGSVPWLDAPAPYAEAQAGIAVPGQPDLAPEVLLSASLPPPLIMLPPREVMIAAAPPSLIFSPPSYALSVWPVLAFAPPLLSVAVLHDEWWTSRYLGRGGYYAGGYYASPGYAGGWYASSAVYAASAVAVAGFAGAGYARHRETYVTQPPWIGFLPGRGRRFDFEDFPGRGHGEGHGEGHGGGHGHGH